MSSQAQGGGATTGMGGLPFFMVVMLISGALNTLLMKFMTMQKVETGPGAASAAFDHPYLCTMFMMIGEFMCLLVYFSSRSREQAARESGNAPNHVYMVACGLDWTATTLVNMAYMFIAASVVQMTRGAIVIFTCLFSVVFLGKRQHRYHMAGVFLVFLGITLVSLSTYINPMAAAHGHAQVAPGSGSGRMFGISLCLLAQVFQATMLVYEEKIMSQYSVPPLRVVGMEGMFGMIFGAGILIVMNVSQVESTPVALHQVGHSTPLMLAILGSICSIAVFNFSGITVTQKASAVARSTIDVSRTILIWAVEMMLGWHGFNPLQLCGFVVLALGTMLYNRLIVLQVLEPPPEAKDLLQKSLPIDVEKDTSV
jgi:drug/metabolite transporter (DMT)-like permease